MIRACLLASLLPCCLEAQSQRVGCHLGPGLFPTGPLPAVWWPQLLLCIRLRDFDPLRFLHCKLVHFFPLSRLFGGPEPMCGVPTGLWLPSSWPLLCVVARPCDQALPTSPECAGCHWGYWDQLLPVSFAKGVIP